MAVPVESVVTGADGLEEAYTLPIEEDVNSWKFFRASQRQPTTAATTVYGRL